MPSRWELEIEIAQRWKLEETLQHENFKKQLKPPGHRNWNWKPYNINLEIIETLNEIWEYLQQRLSIMGL